MVTGTPHIGILYEDQVPPVIFDDFLKLVETDGLRVEIESRETSKGFMGIEWLMPTAVMLFVAKSYFDGFLGDMGKDHYQALKTGIKLLRERFARVKVTMIGTPGKVAAEQPYSLVYSIYFDPGEGRIFKFLIPIDISDEEADAVMDVFLDFLDAYNAGLLPPAERDAIASAPDFGRTMLLSYNPATGRIAPINPMTRTFS